MRLFIAINFNSDTCARLIALREELRSKSQRGRFSLDENLHLTLAFIGEVSPNKLDKIKAIMDTVTFEPFSAAVNRVGRFKRNGGDIWWAGLREDKPLMGLQREVERKLTLCGFKMDGRAYHPHITLGRGIVTDCELWKVLLIGDMASAPMEPFGETVSHIDLMLSERVGGKLTYTSIYRRGKWTRPIVVEPYNPLWEAAFAALDAKLRSIVDGFVVAIHHVGSTSVPGLAAKPILDVDIEIAEMNVFPQIKEQLAKLGYQHEGNYGIEGREAFKYDQSEFMTHRLYVCPSDSAELRRHLALRDYLRSHPDAVREYGELKQSLAAKCGNDIDAYIDGKTAFVERCLSEGKRVYRALPEFDNGEIERILQSGTVEELAVLPLSVGEYLLNWKKAQDICVKLTESESELVRANAALGLAYVARTKRRLEKHIVKPILLKLLKNCGEYRGKIEDSIDDINIFMKWKIGSNTLNHIEDTETQNQTESESYE